MLLLLRIDKNQRLLQSLGELTVVGLMPLLQRFERDLPRLQFVLLALIESLEQGIECAAPDFDLAF